MPRGERAKRGTILWVASIVTIGVALGAMWALLLPIFLSPDEDSHYDYALTLFTAGRPLSPSENVVGRDTHPVVAYLMDATHARQQRLDANVGADPGYGSAPYFRKLDAGAPHVDVAKYRNGPIVPVPYLAKTYPIGYYALAALAIRAGDTLAHGSVVAQFFFARFLSVALLVPMLLFSWLSLRELQIGERRSLAILACIALLPMTAWMAGYVQPDNLAAALVAPIVYLGLRLRHVRSAALVPAALGLLLAALMATKHHYFAAVFLPIAAMLAVRLPFRSDPFRAWGCVAWLVVPPIAAYALTAPLMRSNPGGGGVCEIAGGFAVVRQHGAAAIARFFATGLRSAFAYTFLETSGLRSFWLDYTAYRSNSIVLGAPEVSNAVLDTLPTLSLAMAALFIVRMLQVARRLSTVARRRSLRSALRVATSNVLVNAYLCFVLIICAYEMYVGGYIPLQGRYWLPFIAAIWLIAIYLAPRALPRRLARATSAVVLSLILAFDIAASAFTFPSLHARFYGPPRAIEPAEEVYAGLKAVPDAGVVRFTGFAVDLRNALPVRSIALRVDGGRPIPAAAGDDPEIECDMEGTLLRSGFSATYPIGALAPGGHHVVVLVRVPWWPAPIETGGRATFEVAPKS